MDPSLTFGCVMLEVKSELMDALNFPWTPISFRKFFFFFFKLLSLGRKIFVFRFSGLCVCAFFHSVYYCNRYTDLIKEQDFHWRCLERQMPFFSRILTPTKRE